MGKLVECKVDLAAFRERFANIIQQQIWSEGTLLFIVTQTVGIQDNKNNSDRDWGFRGHHQQLPDEAVLIS